MERLGQRAGGGLLVQAAGSGQLGTGVEDAGGNESADEIALGATGTREQIVQAEMTKGTEDRGDMAVGQRAEDLESLMRIPLKWGTDSGDVGQRRSGATLVTAMISEVPHLSQDLSCLA